MTNESSEGDRLRFREWPGWARGVVYAALLMAMVLVASCVTAVVVARRPLPQVDGTIQLEGLSGTVEVLRDAQGVPQLYADNAADLFHAQGYVQAQDRFWEMDFRRHLTAGRLSELLGDSTVKTDMYIRAMGWRQVAEQEYDLLAPDTRSYLQSYSEGVNEYLAGRSTTKLSAEYVVLGLGGLDYEPEKWTPVDSLAWLKAMAWDLRGNMDEEIERSRLSLRFSPEQVAQLYPPYDYAAHKPIVRSPGRTAPEVARPPLPEEAQQALEAVRRGVDAIPALMGRGEGIGSNSWVVSGEHTATGKPLLANDPHLGTSQPGIWYQMGLHCRKVSPDCAFDVSGFTFAGVPGVVIGHNRSIAWGFTNLDPDVSDLFLEKVTGKTVLYDGHQEPLVERDEVIRIAGGGSREFTVRSSRHGPLLSDVSGELSSVGANADVPEGAPARDNGYAVALSWTALKPRPTADALFMLAQAQGFDDFREAARRFSTPSQNMIYADIDGNIGYQAPGAIPIRLGGRSGDYPVAGWLPQNDWSAEEVPFDELPFELNPAEGFVVTANQAVTGPGYPWFLSNSWDRGYRSQRIRDLLTRNISAARSGGGKLTVADMSRIQNDNRNPMAETLVPLLLRQLMTSGYYADGQRLLVGWDQQQSADSAPAAYFNAVWSNLLRLTFHDNLPESLWPTGGQRWIAVMTNLLRQPSSSWWDDLGTEGVVEDRDQILIRAMKDARDELTRKVSVSPSRWTWGKLHQLRLEHQSLGQSGIGVVERIFNRGPHPAGGGNSIVNATGWDATEGYQVDSAPSMRMVVDLADLDRSRWINLTGASGHVASSHYIDQTRLWLDGRTLLWPSSRKAVLRSAEHTLRLEPTP